MCNLGIVYLISSFSYLVRVITMGHFKWSELSVPINLCLDRF